MTTRCLIGYLVFSVFGLPPAVGPLLPLLPLLLFWPPLPLLFLPLLLLLFWPPNPLLLGPPKPLLPGPPNPPNSLLFRPKSLSFGPALTGPTNTAAKANAAAVDSQVVFNFRSLIFFPRTKRSCGTQKSLSSVNDG